MKRMYVLWLAGFVLLWSQCSEPTKPENTPPSIPPVAQLVPPGSDEAPVQVVGAINGINFYFSAIDQYLKGIANTDPEVNGNIYTWTVSYNGASLKIRAVTRSDKTVTWTVVLNGKAEDGTTYNNWTALIGTTAEDNSSQTWHLYQPNTETKVLQISWQKDNKNNITMTVEYPEANEKVTIVNNTSGTGSYVQTQSGAKLFEASWNADGSGSYTEYDTDGNIVDQGTWQ